MRGVAALLAVASLAGCRPGAMSARRSRQVQDVVRQLGAVVPDPPDVEPYTMADGERFDAGRRVRLTVADGR